MGFMDKAKKMAEQAQTKLDEAQKSLQPAVGPRAGRGPAGGGVRQARPADPAAAAARGRDAAARRPAVPARRPAPEPPPPPAPPAPPAGAARDPCRIPRRPRCRAPGPRRLRHRPRRTLRLRRRRPPRPRPLRRAPSAGAGGDRQQPELQAAEDVRAETRSPAERRSGARRSPRRASRRPACQTEGHGSLRRPAHGDGHAVRPRRAVSTRTPPWRSGATCCANGSTASSCAAPPASRRRSPTRRCRAWSTRWSEELGDQGAIVGRRRLQRHPPRRRADRARGRGRRARHPLGHAVLQPAQPPRPPAPLRGGRARRRRAAGDPLQHPQPHRAEHAGRPAGRSGADRRRGGRQAGQRRTSCS